LIDRSGFHLRVIWFPDSEDEGITILLNVGNCLEIEGRDVPDDLNLQQQLSYKIKFQRDFSFWGHISGIVFRAYWLKKKWGETAIK